MREPDDTFSYFLQVIRQFPAQECRRFSNGTSRTKYIEDSAVGATIHSYRGANLIDFLNVVNQYPPLNLRSVCIVAGFNDHHYSCSHFIECCQVLLDIICYQFQPLIDVSHKIIASPDNKLVNRKIYYINWALHHFLQIPYSSFNHFTSFFFSKFSFSRYSFLFLQQTFVYLVSA